jgi:hypothetical protein
MVLEFYREHHSSDAIREAVPDLSLKEVISICLASKTSGTRVGPELVKRLSDRVTPLRFAIGANTLDQVERREERGLPTILIYDGVWLLQGRQGGAHAGVYVGRAKDGDPVLNNPWVGALYVPPRQKFLDAWELHGMLAMTVDPIPQTKLPEA